MGHTHGAHTRGTQHSRSSTPGAALPEQWCRGAAPGEQLGVSGALLNHARSGFELATLRLPVQLLNQYATDASKLVVLTNRNQTTTSSDMTCVAVLLHHNPRGHI